MSARLLCRPALRLALTFLALTFLALLPAAPPVLAGPGTSIVIPVTAMNGHGGPLVRRRTSASRPSFCAAAAKTGSVRGRPGRDAAGEETLRVLDKNRTDKSARDVLAALVL